MIAEDLKQLRIGYVPYTNNLDRPGDRRRFCFYAKENNIKFEIADINENYDLVVVTEQGDISSWERYHGGNSKIIYDFIDSYLAIPFYNIKSILRGTAKYCAGQYQYLHLFHRRLLEKMCSASDAVICTTEEQYNLIKSLNENAHIILDFHDDDIKSIKPDYECGKTFNIVWEGLPQNVEQLSILASVLNRLSDKYDIALHLVTDLQYGKFMGKYYKKNVLDVVKKIYNKTYVHEWNNSTCSSIIAACDLAIIPIDLTDPFAKGKPENKLLFFWRIGMPTITSASPAYSRAMNKAGLNMTCNSEDDWLVLIEEYINNKTLREKAGLKGREVAALGYSKEIMLEQWDKVFRSVL